MHRLPTKVLHVMNGAGGGAALSTLGLIAELSKRGIESAVVTDVGGTPLEREQLAASVDGRCEVIPLYWWNKKLRASAWKRPLLELRQQARTGAREWSRHQVARAARRFGVELIHTNTFLTPEGGSAAATLGLPHVWHVRELLGAGNPFEIGWSPPRVRRFVRGHCSVLVANSQATARGVQAQLPAAPLQVVPNGIDLSAFSAVERPVRDRVVFGMVANLTSRTKKHALYLRAAALAAREVSAEFRLYGHLPREGVDAYVDALRAEPGPVTLMGHQPPDRIMASLDVLVHPADNESFGRTVVEAMAAALPVIGADGGGVAESIEQGVTGVLVRPDDPHALAAALVRLGTDASLRERLGRAGRVRAERRFSLAATTDGVCDAYRFAMSRPLTSSASTVATLLGALRA